MTEDNMMDADAGRMSLREYQKWTPTTAIYDPKYSWQYLTAGFVAEVGEFYGASAKEIRDDTCNWERMRKEMGDIMWFISQLCNYHGWDLEKILYENKQKLEDRKKRDKLGGSGDDR